MPEPSQQEQKERPKRLIAHYLDLSRSVAQNHFRTEKTKEPVIDPHFTIGDFFSKKIFMWFKYYIQSRFGKVHDYPPYKLPDTGIYKLTKSTDSENDFVSLAVVGDWATDTDVSDRVSQRIFSHNPDYTIHIGDTYFVGEPKEIKRNFIDEGASWVRGNVGSFALLGNHEMYAKGDAFFKYLLPSLGIKTTDGKYDGQKAGFFCIENDHWRILGLDTGYHSIGKIPIIEMLPWFAPDCHFDDVLMEWLRNTVKLTDPDDKRGLVILTHHQYISAFKKESEYMKPASQLASLIGKNRKILWLWGHEHKFSVFEKAQVNEGVTAYGRCIGHGGMPIELNSIEQSDKMNGFPKLIMVDTRMKTGTEDYPLGYNGYTIIKIKDAGLVIEYYDINNKLLTEKWSVDSSGNITGTISPEPSCPLAPEPGKTWKDAVKE